MKRSHILAGGVSADAAMLITMHANHSPAWALWSLAALTGITAAGAVSAHHTEQRQN